MTIPAYKKVGDAIRQRINEGVYPLGSQLPTELEMVEAFNLSRMTVSKGLTELIDAGLIKRIRGKGTFVCSQRFDGVDSKSDVPVIKCIFPGAIYEQSFASNMLLQGVCAELKNSRFQTGIVFCGSDREIIAELEKAETDNCVGYILWPSLSEKVCAAVSRLRDAGFPLVLLDSFFSGYSGEFVGTDNFAGADAVVEFLASRGHRRIAYLTLCPDRSSLAERLAGFFGALARRGLPVVPRWVGTIPAAPELPSEKVANHNTNFIQQFLHQLVVAPAGERPTAIFTSHDFIAIEIMKLAETLPVQIPGELSLVGFDNIDCSKWLPIPLTTVAHDFDGIGRLAARLLMERCSRASPIVASPRYYVVPQLLERNSVLDIR